MVLFIFLFRLLALSQLFSDCTHDCTGPVICLEFLCLLCCCCCCYCCQRVNNRPLGVLRLTAGGGLQLQPAQCRSLAQLAPPFHSVPLDPQTPGTGIGTPTSRCLLLPQVVNTSENRRTLVGLWPEKGPAHIYIYNIYNNKETTPN